MGTRTARLAFAVYAVTVGLSMGLGLWHRHLIAQLGQPHHDVALQLKILDGAFIGLEVLGILAIGSLTRLPRSLRAGTLVWTAAGLATLALVIAQAQRFLFDAHLGEAQLRTIFRVVGVSLGVAYAASEILILVVALRVARAVPAEWLRGLAIAAVVSRAATTIVLVTPLAGAWTYWLLRASLLLVIIVCAGAAAVVTRLLEPAPPTIASDDGRLSPAWRAPAQGIALYLGAALARIVLALFSWLAMQSANRAYSVFDLRDLRGTVVTLAVLSGLASLAMLTGLWRISRAPAETRAAGPALLALALGSMGLLLDVWSTSILADALEGHVDAAFFAMKALPVIAGFSLLVGVALALSLLHALSLLATALGRADVAEHARGGSYFLVGAGAAGVMGVALSSVAAELVIVLLVIAVPLALAATVQFLRVAFGVSREIRVRVN